MMDTAMTADAKFWDKAAPGYFKKPIKDQSTYERKLEITRQYLTPETRLLELGCGTGGTAIAHAPSVKSVHAADISGEMLDIARRQAAEAGADIRFDQVDTSRFEAPPASYDAVLALSHLHLLEDWQRVIGNVYDMLAPGGVFVSSTACLSDSMNWFRFIAPVGRALGIFPTVLIFSADTLRKTMTDAGFEIVEDWTPPKSIGVFIVARKP